MNTVAVIGAGQMGMGIAQTVARHGMKVLLSDLDLAHAEAGRYRSRGIPLDDLRQVAALALTKAARGYDVTTGHDFLSYAVPTIRGELRKHFRDHGWMIRPPRRIQEMQARINTAQAELSYSLGRSPKPVEIADHIDEGVENVIEALASDGCFVPASLDHPTGGDGSATLGDLLPSATTSTRPPKPDSCSTLCCATWLSGTAGS